MDPINAPAKELVDAITVFEKMIEGHVPVSGDDVPTFVFAFFLGAGSALSDCASAVLFGRVQEMTNQEELEGITAEVSALEAALDEDRCSVFLMQKCHALLYNIKLIMNRKKKDIQYFTPAQQLVLREHRERFTESIRTNMNKFWGRT